MSTKLKLAETVSERVLRQVRTGMFGVNYSGRSCCLI